MQKRHSYTVGFALPTVLITSIVMLIILAVSVTSVAAVRTGLKTQYYETLAKEAGEAGVAYAKACLAKNSNVPQWSNANPLTPGTDCSGNALSGVNCPGDAGCYVMTNGTVRSSFSVPAPTVNSAGQAVTIPNRGYVELTRGSNGSVWRTYQQPTVQAAVVPDLCSGAATSALGWSNAVAASAANDGNIPEVPSATTITLANSPLPGGQMYFRRDFTVNVATTYKVSVQTNSSKDQAEIYIDGTYSTTAQGSVASASVALSVGCHTITARLTNHAIAGTYSQFTAAVNVAGNPTPIVATDTSWRADAGNVVDFSSGDYYVDPSLWAQVVPYGSTHAQLSNSGWWYGGDVFTAMITPPGNGCPGSCPYNASAYLRDSKDFYLAADTSVTTSLLCDNYCELYIDGQPTMEANWSDISARTFTLTKGYHHVGIQLYNSSTSGNPAGVGMSIVQAGGGNVYSRTDRSWLGTTSWLSGNTGDMVGYEGTFQPSPDEIHDPVTADILVVGGGGGGGVNASGGGGGGGAIFKTGVALSTTTYTVTIGGGGAGSSSNFAAGSVGGNSAFGSYTAYGGGGGASRDGGTQGTNGGSGGGGAGASSSTQVPGGSTLDATQGSNGGAGTAADAGANATGGGGGGGGNAGMYGAAGGQAGNGGAGLIFYLDGTRLAVAGGGGGTITVNGSSGYATDGGGGGSPSTPGSGSANTGGGGGGRGTAGTAGSGGSGVVVIRFKTGSATVSATGTYAVTTATVRNINYTIYKFTSSGTFVVSALNPS